MQHNALLENHMRMQSNRQQNNPFANSNINAQRQEYKMRQMEKINEIEQNYDIDKIREVIIKPLSTKPDRYEHNETKKKYAELEQNYEPTRKSYWSQRTNQPYKNIIKDRVHIDKFIGRQKIKEDELVIHKVSKQDKVGVDEKLNGLKENINTHNKELGNIYSLSNETEHKKKFEYNHKYKYGQSYNPTDHNEMKQNRIEIFKKAQLKINSEKEKIENVLEVLLDDGNLEDEEFKGIPGLKTITPKIIEIKPRDSNQDSNEQHPKSVSSMTKVAKLNNKESIKNITPRQIDTRIETKPKTQLSKISNKSNKSNKSNPVIIRKKN